MIKQGVVVGRKKKRKNSAAMEGAHPLRQEPSIDLTWASHNDKPWAEIKDTFRTTLIERIDALLDEFINPNPSLSPFPIVLDVMYELVNFINFMIRSTDKKVDFNYFEIYCATTPKKVSYHAILAETVYFNQMATLKKFILAFREHCVNTCPTAFVGGSFIIDVSVYRRNANFRLPFASKYGQDNYLVPVPQRPMNLNNFMRGMVRIFPNEAHRFSVLVSAPVLCVDAPAKYPAIVEPAPQRLVLPKEYSLPTKCLSWLEQNRTGDEVRNVIVSYPNVFINMRNEHYCRRAGRAHRHNNISYVYNLVTNVISQTCNNEICKKSGPAYCADLSEDALPFANVERKGFQRLVQPTLDALKETKEHFPVNAESARSLIPEKAEELREKLKEELEGRVLGGYDFQIKHVSAANSDSGSDMKKAVQKVRELQQENLIADEEAEEDLWLKEEKSYLLSTEVLKKELEGRYISVKIDGVSRLN
ncbi:unnamed protein product [Bemisia tabaci]|uniref:DNA-directed primase/polymerase protein n=1 Tax=Bemisia tabaci TaxID=7038 RepID=A0A9P0AIB1_BEMTA|nr:unnamed protein product [Bemisia tabaci]